MDLTEVEGTAEVEEEAEEGKE
ncbi:MAG: hypothetical protein UV33_C0016G0013, partial [Candidatus Daviesbacteria bacterium GW2011_GWA1_42_6]